MMVVVVIYDDHHAQVSILMRIQIFCEQVSEEMTQQPQEQQALYSKVMGSATNELISPKSTKAEKTLAITIAGALAKATHAIYGMKVGPA